MKYYKLEITDNGKFRKKVISDMGWEGSFYFSGGIMYGTECAEKDLEKVKNKLIKKCLAEAVKESKIAQNKVTKLLKLQK